MAYFVISPDWIPYVSTVANTIISFTPLLSYGSTVLSIRRKKSSQGFSIDICGTMLVASILRIFYYFNEPFEITLLRQCFIMVFIQTILLNTALKYRSSDAVHFEKFHNNWERLYNQISESNYETIEKSVSKYNLMENFERYNLKDMVTGTLKLILNLIQCNVVLLFSTAIQILRNFFRLFDYHYVRPFYYWQWKKSITFWKFLAGFIAFLTIIQVIFNGNEYLGVILGSMSFMIESSLPLPQILLFQRLKNVENFKTILLLSWLGGDVTKISYLVFGTNNISTLFVIAAFSQMSLNLFITYQFFYYKFNPQVMPDANIGMQLSHLPTSVSPKSASFTLNGFQPLSRDETLGTAESLLPISPPSINRASSFAVNDVINNSHLSKTTIPQHQHNKSFVHREANSNEGSYHDDGIDVADGVPTEDFILGKVKNKSSSIEQQSDESYALIEDVRPRANSIIKKPGEHLIGAIEENYNKEYIT